MENNTTLYSSRGAGGIAIPAIGAQSRGAAGTTVAPAPAVVAAETEAAAEAEAELEGLALGGVPASNRGASSN